MPIRHIWEKRHHLGEMDIGYPIIVCDVCGERIANAVDGNYYWQDDWEHWTGDDGYKNGTEILFAHLGCDFRLKDNVRLSWGALEEFPLFLSCNLAMNVTASGLKRAPWDDGKYKTPKNRLSKSKTI
jgi:hypothetical protein